MKKIDILIVEDNSTMRLGMVETLKRDGFSVKDFSSGPEALDYVKKSPASLAIVDLKMEPMDGIEVLRQIKKLEPGTEVLMISAYGTVETAVEAIKSGAADFLTKPFSPQELRIRVQKIFEKIAQQEQIRQLQEENWLLKEEIDSPFKEIIGRSPAIRQIFKLIQQVAKEDSTVLIEGESGTGKELVARAIHRLSPRNGKPFIKINCGALNDNLLESELFGHEKGAFTGALRQKKGRFELADGGTIFLDEIGDISPALQIKLLRVIQEREFERVGGETTISVNVRIISATNQNLQQAILEGKFREDLFYRLSVIPIRIPPLRDRREDIPLLVQHFLSVMAEKRGQPPRSISEEGMALLMQYPWPGNIRELENFIERLVVTTPNSEISAAEIARYLGTQPTIHQSYENLPLEMAVENFERNLIIQALRESGGNKSQAARKLNIKLSTLYYKLEKYGFK